MLALIVNNTTAINDGVVQFEALTTGGTSPRVVAVSMGATTTVTLKAFVGATASTPWVAVASGITASGIITLPGPGLYTVNVTRSGGTDRVDVTVHGAARAYPPSNVV